MSSLVSWLSSLKRLLGMFAIIKLFSPYVFSPYVWKKRLLDLPDNLRIAALTSWRDKERGLAVFAGVFLASLVITLVLIY